MRSRPVLYCPPDEIRPYLDKIRLAKRCGLVDHLSLGSQCRWDVGTIKWHCSVKFPGADKIYNQACSKWADVCNLKFQQVSTAEEAHIVSRTGRIDGKNGILAWSELPGKGKVQQVFDYKESWVVYLMYYVMLHEIGHALGLGHGPNGSVMQVYAFPVVLGLQDWDVQQIRDLYGPKSRNTAMAKKPKSKPKPRPKPMGSC